MNYYYLLNNEQLGPIEDSEFERLVRSGIITDATLVWREGMTEWQPYRELAVPLPQPGLLRIGGQCIECGGSFGLEDLTRVGTGYVCASCRPVAMQKSRETVPTFVSKESEKMRKAHLKHEASVRSIGLLYFLGAVLMILAGLAGLFSGVATTVLWGLVLLVLGAAQLWIGIGLRRLESWARVPTGIISGLGLLAFPLGTLIHAYVLYLVFSQKGATVLSPRYKQIIAETPHVKYRTSVLMWILLGVVILFFLAILSLPFLVRLK